MSCCREAGDLLQLRGHQSARKCLSGEGEAAGDTGRYTGMCGDTDQEQAQMQTVMYEVTYGWKDTHKTHNKAYIMYVQ